MYRTEQGTAERSARSGRKSVINRNTVRLVLF